MPIANLRIVVDKTPVATPPQNLPNRIRQQSPQASSAAVYKLVFVDPDRAVKDQRAYPSNMYVDVPTVTKTISAVVFYLCVLSLLMSFVSGFSLIDRFFSILFAFFAAGFYLMACLMARRHGSGSNP